MRLPFAVVAVATLTTLAVDGAHADPPVLPGFPSLEVSATVDDGETRETVRVGTQAKSPSTKTSRRKSTKAKKRKQRKTRRRHRQPATVHHEVRVEETETSTTVEQTTGGLFGGFGVRMNIQLPADDAPAAPPAMAPAAPAPRPVVVDTCKSVLLDMGHPSSALLHCDDVNDQCAMAVLRAGHNPSSLVHCGDVENTSCAVQMMAQGRNPAEIIHCN